MHDQCKLDTIGGMASVSNHLPPSAKMYIQLYKVCTISTWQKCRPKKINIVWFQELPYSLHGSLSEIPKGGGGVFKAKLFKGKYEDKLEFPEEWGEGVQTQKTVL